MKTTRSLLVFAALALALAGCVPGLSNRDQIVGSGNVKSETRELSGFDRVELAGSGDVTIKFGDRESVVVEADDNLLPYLMTNVHVGTLIIETKRNTNITTRNGLHYTVTVKSLKGVTLSGSGSITCEGIQADAIDVMLAGSGTVTLAGQAASQKVQLPGSGNYRAGDLKTGTADVSIAGSGAVTVWATERLDASITGSGMIEYYGSPAVTKSILGSGSVVSKGER